MIRAIVKNGKLKALDPLPPEWADGRRLTVEDENGQGAEEPFDIDKWYETLEAMAAKSDPKDAERLEAALQDADAQAKAWMRREMGLE
jgi:hypothetical protein